MIANITPSRRSHLFSSVVLCGAVICGSFVAAEGPRQFDLYEANAEGAIFDGIGSPNANSWLQSGVSSKMPQDSARAMANPDTEIPDRWARRLNAGPIFRGQSPHCCGYEEGCGYGEKPKSCFRLTEFNIYPTFSYLDDLSATYNEFEFASHTDFGSFEMENRTVLNVADLPGTIALGPTNPNGAGGKVNVRANGFGDILSGFFFSPKGSHEKKVHVGIGPVITFPTASNEILGSSQYTAGPGIHASAELGKLTAGFFLWQSWGWDVGFGDKRVNQLFGKPFLLYELSEKWNLIYIPLGLSHSWHAKSGDDWTVPVGGGFRRLFTVRGRKMGIQMQGFDYVARKAKDPEWELRFTIEFLFD